MRIFQVFFYTAISIFLFTTGIPNEIFSFGMPLSGLLSLIPFYLALKECRSYRQAGLVTSLLASLVHLTSSFWLSNFKEYAMLTLGATTIAYFILGYLTGQILYIPFRQTRTGTEHLGESAGTRPFNSIIRILFFACAWTLNEWCKSTGFLAYPWGTLILTAWKWKLITQVAALTGTWGISFLFSLFAATAAELIMLIPERSPRQPLFKNGTATPAMNAALFTASLFALTLIYGTIEYVKPRTPVKTLNTVLVQHDADSWEDSDEYCIAVAERLTEEALASTDEKADLVVWSEGFLTYILPDSLWYYEFAPAELPLTDHIRNTGVPHIIGAPYVMDEEGTQFGNSAVLFGPDADIIDYYAKIHLVPFAEGIPFENQRWMQLFMQKVAGFSRGWQAGSEYKLFTVNGSEPVTISTPICFEDAFPSVCRKLFLAGSEVFMNITNDSWSEMDSSEYQHYVISSYRAIEYRTTLVRSTNAGYTTVTDPCGRILTDLPLFEEASVFTSVPVYERTLTPYALLGDWLPLAALVLIILYFFHYLYSAYFLQLLDKKRLIEEK